MTVAPLVKPLAPPPEALRAPFVRILCGVNGSRCSDVAVEQALALAGDDATVHFLALSDVRGAGAMRMAELGTRRAERAVVRARRRAAALGVTATGEVRRDVDARHGLVARARAYDLLVLGTHGHSRAEGILLGSTAALALHACETPVLIARRPPGGRGVADRVVKATHAVAGDRALAEIAARIAARAGGSLTLLHVATPERRPLRRELAQEAVDVLALMATEPVVVTARGHTAEAIVSSAADLDASLIVLGSRGLSGLHALASVSERVGAHAPCSVLVVRGATA